MSDAIHRGFRNVEDVFVTDGTPQDTFVEPPNFNEILVDIRHPTKPVIIEGPSGSGKSTAILKVLEKLGERYQAVLLKSRNPLDLEKIVRLSDKSTPGTYIIDDFHRLSNETQSKLGDIAKLAADNPQDNVHPKIIIVGINRVGVSLIQFVDDVRKRLGIHRIEPADQKRTFALISKGEESLNIRIPDKDSIFEETRGDYWLTQKICQNICVSQGILTELEEIRSIYHDIKEVRAKLVGRLSQDYHKQLEQFCRGKKVRPTNDAYFRILRGVAAEGTATTDLGHLAANRPDLRQTINNVKNTRLADLLESKPEAGKIFFFNVDTMQFIIEDPAVLYLIKHMDWEAFRRDLGLRIDPNRDFDFDIAVSFAGENRWIAKYIAKILDTQDISCYVDENYETDLLGVRMSQEFERIFSSSARLVVALLDRRHRDKLWPTFERACFKARISEKSVIPVFLDDTPFPEIPNDLKGIRITGVHRDTPRNQKIIYDKIVEPLIGKASI